MPIDFSTFFQPILKQAGKAAVDFGKHILQEGLVARAVPIDGLYAISDERYYVASTVPALLAAWQAYTAKGGKVPPGALGAASGLSMGGDANIILPANPNATGDSVLVIVPGALTRAAERVLAPCGFRKVAFVRARYVRGQRGRRVPNEVWAWIG